MWCEDKHQTKTCRCRPKNPFNSFIAVEEDHNAHLDRINNESCFKTNVDTVLFRGRE